MRGPKKQRVKKPGPPAGTVSRAEAAAHFGVAPMRINRWVEEGAPQAVRGSRGHQAYYDLEALKAWRAARGPKEPGQASLNLGEERARLASAQAEKVERENLVRSGELVARADAEAEGQKVLAALKARLIQAPRACVMRGMPREHEALVRAVVLEALREMSGWVSVEDATATAKAS